MKLRKKILFVAIVVLVFAKLGLSQNADSLRVVVAQKGDGIYKILRENGFLPSEYYNEFLELNQDKIKEDDSLIRGETYYLPYIVVLDSINNELFPLNDTLPLIDTSFNELQFADTIIDGILNGAVFYLVSGHGGPDPGAVTEIEGQTVSEDEYAYDITLRIARSIEEHGGLVYMIINDPNDSIREEKYLKIDYDEYCYPDLEIPRNQYDRLKQRADAVNDLYAIHKDSSYNRVIVIHVDSRAIGAKVDVFFYFYPGSKVGKATAEALQGVFAAKYEEHQPNRGYEGTVTSRNLMVIRKSIPPAIFIELGNIQNDRDRKRFFSPSNRQALAKWITEGLIKDYENSKE